MYGQVEAYIALAHLVQWLVVGSTTLREREPGSSTTAPFSLGNQIPKQEVKLTVFTYLYGHAYTRSCLHATEPFKTKLYIVLYTHNIQFYRLN